VDEARRLNHDYIGAEHLLLGLLCEGEGVAVGVLESLDVDLEKVRAATVAALKTLGTPEATGTQPEGAAHGSHMASGPRANQARSQFLGFTERARKVLTLAQQEAQRFSHNHIGTEHLLLGLVREDDAVGAKVLVSLGISLENVSERVEHIVGQDDYVALGEVGLTPRAKKVIERAVDEARRLGAERVGMEHLLLGMLREGEGIAAGVLVSLGATLEKARAATVVAVGRPGAAGTSPSGVTYGPQTPGASRPHQGYRDSFGRFTERARKVLSLSQEEAQRFNHNYIGTEHLLLGLVREGDGVAAKVLQNLSVGLQGAREQVEQIIGRGDRVVVGEIGLTPRAKKVLELAVDEARRLNHHYIGTEHLLLGLIREGEGIAARVLEGLGVNLERARAMTIQVVSGQPPEASPEDQTHES